MLREDIEQVEAIEASADSLASVPVNYHSELLNPLAHYMVACDEEDASKSDCPRCKRFVKGYIGLWYMAEEVHVMYLSVRQDYRRKGIGELLLIYGINLSVYLTATQITLEVRESNSVAYALYTKYGFTERGTRLRYYHDNHENARIMTLDQLHSTSFQTTFKTLKTHYLQKHKESITEGTIL